VFLLSDSSKIKTFKKRAAELAESDSGDSDVAVIGTYSGSVSDRETSSHYNTRIRKGGGPVSASHFGGAQSHVQGSNERISKEHARDEGHTMHSARICAHSDGP